MCPSRASSSLAVVLLQPASRLAVGQGVGNTGSGARPSCAVGAAGSGCRIEAADCGSGTGSPATTQSATGAVRRAPAALPCRRSRDRRDPTARSRWRPRRANSWRPLLRTRTSRRRRFGREPTKLSGSSSPLRGVPLRMKTGASATAAPMSPTHLGRNATRQGPAASFDERRSVGQRVDRNRHGAGSQTRRPPAPRSRSAKSRSGKCTR